MTTKGVGLSCILMVALAGVLWLRLDESTPPANPPMPRIRNPKPYPFDALDAKKPARLGNLEVAIEQIVGSPMPAVGPRVPDFEKPYLNVRLRVSNLGESAAEYRGWRDIGSSDQQPRLVDDEGTVFQLIRSRAEPMLIAPKAGIEDELAFPHPGQGSYLILELPICGQMARLRIARW